MAGVLALPSLLHAETTPKDPLLAEEARHAEALNSLQTNQRERLEKLRTGYANALDKVEASATARGDLETVLAAKKEKESIALEPREEKETAALASRVAHLRGKFDTALRQIAADGRSREIGLLERHARQLLELQEHRTRNSEIEAAVKVREARKLVLARLKAMRSTPAPAPASLAGSDRQPKPAPKATTDPTDERPGGITPTGDKPRRVAESVRAKGDVERPAANVIPFDGPIGDGRIGAKGILVKSEDAAGDVQGSTWTFNYTRGGHARGLQIFHPRGKGQTIVHLNRDGVGITQHGQWRKSGYSGGNAEGIRREKAFAEVFPLQDNRGYRIASRMDRTGNYALSIDGQVVATCTVGEASPLSLLPPEGGRFSREPAWVKTPGFRGENLPLEWQANWAGLLLGPLDRGVHFCEDVRYCEGVAEIGKPNR